MAKFENKSKKIWKFDKNEMKLRNTNLIF